MEPIEIITIIACVAIVFGVFGNYVYRRAKGKPTGDCACCSHTKAGSNLVKMYHKKYKCTCNKK